MSKLLHIVASPRGFDSYSTQVAEAFLETFKPAHPNYGLETLDLFHADLPAFEAPQASAKYAVMAGQKPAGPAEKAWKEVIDVINHFKSADMYLIASPMWNFGIPYRLKQYFDIIVQPGLTFTYSAKKGYVGLVTGKKVVLALARGGAYPAGTEATRSDMQKSYLETILAFIGLTDVQSLIVEPTLGSPPEEISKALANAQQQARELGNSI